ncbi:DNA translocase FtsK [Thiorhodospira sibirica]|uniref:DNA translocase FtsK n=1 Tax=Thiorhodospira sibirica TaxID=154347 RepID=UPI00022C33E5|nr:DNA translocase FtsK [Thiorhodospira sibirica]
MTQATPKKSNALSQAWHELSKARAVQRWIKPVLQAMHDGVLLLAAALAVYLLIILFSYQPTDPGWSHTGSNLAVANWGGRFGAWLADFSLFLVGYLAYLAPAVVMYAAWLVSRRRKHRQRTKDAALSLQRLWLRMLGLALLLLSGCMLAALHFLPGNLPISAGGILGQVFGDLSAALLGLDGATLVLLAVFLLGLTWLLQFSWLQLMDRLGAQCLRFLPEPKARPAPPPIHPDDALFDAPPRNNPPHRADAKPAPIFSAAEDEPLPDTPTPPEASAAETASRKGQRIEPVIPMFVQQGTVTAPPPFRPFSLDAKTTEAPTELSPSLMEGRDHEMLQPIEPMPSGASAYGKTPLPPLLDPLPTPRAAKAAPQLPPLAQAPLEPPQPLLPKTKNYKRPSLTLLDTVPVREKGHAKENLQALSQQVELAFVHLGLNVTVDDVCMGPVVTHFELSLATSTRVSLAELAVPLAEALAVDAVRIIEPILPFSKLVLEVPNEIREAILLAEILQSDTYQRGREPLTLALGKDATGRVMTADMARMPHLLMAGARGSGKSVAIHAMLMGLLFKATPADLRLILIDTKLSELAAYKDLPHLLIPLVTDMDNATAALRWCIQEVERRYQLVAKQGVRNLAEYNEILRKAQHRGVELDDPDAPLNADGSSATQKPLPYIVITINELADMMVLGGKEVEDLIVRLSQKARAAGVHLMLSTQRPTMHVITQAIKAHIPNRIALKVSARVDSRNILDRNGAEQLLGCGDMLYLSPGGRPPRRVHGAFVAEHEIQAVTAFIKSQGDPEYVSGIVDDV